MNKNEYLLDNRHDEAENRFSALSEIFDAWTFRHIEELGIKSGWRCWEVGAGGTGVVHWLSQRVGSEGFVLATDIDTSRMESVELTNIKVLCHNVASEQIPEGGFDLVHARLVLVHIAERDKALQSMIQALRPGGWLFVEDADPSLQPLACLDVHNEKEQLANKLRAGFRQLMSKRGVDLAYGRKLPRLLLQAGLMDVRADGYFPVLLPACQQLEIATVNLIRDQLIGEGLATADDIVKHSENVASGSLHLTTAPLISVWGRKPIQSPPRVSGKIEKR